MQRARTNRSGRFLSAAAFTLIENALAIGVVAVGLVGILSLFPLGLRSTRTATDDTQMAIIAQDYAAYYEQLTLTNVNYAANPAQGLLAPQDYVETVTNNNVIYNVHVVVANSGFPQLQSGNTNLLSRAIIEIWRPGSATNTYVTDVGRYVMQ